MPLLLTDPIDITLDPVTGDLPAGDLTMTSGIAAVMQGARIRLRMFAGEWFANLDAGVRYLERDGVTAAQALLGQPFNRAKAIREFRAALLGDPSRNVVAVPGIVSLKTLDAKYDGPTRTMTVTWQAVTAFGDTPLDLISIGA
jgi:hypothetical protein